MAPAAFPVAGYKQVVSFATTHCTLGAQFAGRIGLDEAACVAIRQAYEQWDDKGHPDHLRGRILGLPARLAATAAPVEVFARRRGIEAAASVARRHARYRVRPGGRGGCSARMHPDCWTAWIRLRTGMRSWALSRSSHTWYVCAD